MVEIAAFGLPISSEFPIGIGRYYQSWINPEKLQDSRQWMSFDPGRAKSLLDGAGYRDRNGDGFRDLANGETIRIRLSAPAGWTDWINVLSTAVQNLRDIGIDASLSTPDEDAWYENIRAGEDDAVIMWAEVGATPWHTYWSMFNPSGMAKGNVNLTQFHQQQSPEIVALLEQFGTTTDLTEQRQIMTEVEQLVAQQLPVIHLFSNPGWYQYNDARFQGWVTEQQPYVRPFIQKDVPERLIHVLNLSLKPWAVAP
jgi:peptide/nickel transport system substrate-binding protein